MQEEIVTVKPGLFGIAIQHHAGDTGGAVISSNMKELEAPGNDLFNSAVDGLESIILAHFCAGVDITSKNYKEGIKTADLGIYNLGQ